MSINIQTLQLGLLQTNCYVITTSANRVWVLDPGADAEIIIEILRQNCLQLQGILLTHGHVDHIGGLPGLIAEFARTPVYLHAADLELYQSPDNAVPPWLPAVADLPLPTTDFTPLADENIIVRETPGHTRGGVCYYFPDAGFCCVGDTLFRDSVGRTDLPGGDAKILLQSIHEKLLTLPPATRILSGHGPETSIARECKHNPFL